MLLMFIVGVRGFIGCNRWDNVFGDIGNFLLVGLDGVMKGYLLVK